jgi:hypothetical protein
MSAVAGHETSANQYCALGMHFSVAVDDPASAPAVVELLRAFEAPLGGVSAPVRRYCIDTLEGESYRLTCDDEVLASNECWPRVVTTLMVDLNRHAIDAFEGFAVHAGVVAMGGNAIAFPGESGIGKSTLTAACIDAGFAYVSDEALCIDHDHGHVVPYPRPIALSPHGWHLARLSGAPENGIDDGVEVLFSAAQLDARLTADVLKLAHVVQLVRDEGPARLVSMPRSRALASLLEMSFNHYKDPDGSFRTASQLAVEAHAWRLEYSDPQQAARLLRAELTA